MRFPVTGQQGHGHRIIQELINKKQILPHSKIDSFVYASKPESMYNEWGNFWDPNNKQRNLFQSIYNVYKEMDKEKRIVMNNYIYYRYNYRI